MPRPSYGVEAGRGITRNGERILTILRVGGISPTEADDLARLIARLLDEHAAREAAPDVVLVPLTREQVALLADAVDCRVYERAPDHAHRSSGAVIDPRLDPDYDEDEPMSDEDREICDFLDEHDHVTTILSAYLPKES